MKRGITAVLLAVLLAGCSAIPGLNRSHNDTPTPPNTGYYPSSERERKLDKPFTVVSGKIPEGLMSLFFGGTRMYILKPNDLRLNEAGATACQRFKVSTEKPVKEAPGKLVLLCSFDLETAAVAKLGSDNKPVRSTVTSVTFGGATMYKDPDDKFVSVVKRGDTYRATTSTDVNDTVQKLDEQLLGIWGHSMQVYFRQDLPG